MPRRPKRQPVDWLIKQINANLRALDEGVDGLELRDKVLKLVELQHHISDLGVSITYENGIQANAARERIRLYLVMYEGMVINSDELQVVSGISDYPRRIRELRREEGYQIASGSSPDPTADVNLKPDEYILVSKEPDVDAARRWHIANRIRRHDAGCQERLLMFFHENVGRIVTTEELAYIAKGAKEFARRVRELRTEQGYLIATKFTGRPDLNMGQYVLESLDRISESHDRNVKVDVQRAVYARDNNTCVCCGWTRDQWSRDNPRILELHHLDEHAGGGENTVDNLAVVCSRCHDDIHADRINMVRGADGIRCDRVLDDS